MDAALLAIVTALGSVFTLLYRHLDRRSRDCEADRRELWKHVIRLESGKD